MSLVQHTHLQLYWNMSSASEFWIAQLRKGYQYLVRELKLCMLSLIQVVMLIKTSWVGRRRWKLKSVRLWLSSESGAHHYLLPVCFCCCYLKEIYYHSIVKWHFLLLFLKTPTSAFCVTITLSLEFCWSDQWCFA